MPLTTTAKNALLNELGSLATWVSLHTANPTDAGTSEVTGGSPAYARKQVTWSAASAGNLDTANVPVFDVPGSTTINYFGLWSASTGGTLYAHGPLIAPETYIAQGTYTLSDGDVNIA